jgi:hypothetical protein
MGCRCEDRSVPITLAETPKPKRQISDEGMKRIIAATRKRWALKRAEAQAALKKAKPKDKARNKAAVTALPAKAVRAMITL